MFETEKNIDSERRKNNSDVSIFAKKKKKKSSNKCFSFLRVRVEKSPTVPNICSVFPSGRSVVLSWS